MCLWDSLLLFCYPFSSVRLWKDTTQPPIRLYQTTFLGIVKPSMSYTLKENLICWTFALIVAVLIPILFIGDKGDAYATQQIHQESTKFIPLLSGAKLV